METEADLSAMSCLPVPLANARATGIGQNNATYIPQDLCLQGTRGQETIRARHKADGSE